MLLLRRVGAVPRLLATLLLSFACGIAHAGCIESPDPAIGRLQALAFADPHKALAGAQAMLARSKATRAPPEKLAWLHAVRAEAYSALELDGEARNAAAQGARLVADASAPVRLALFFTDAENIYDAQGMADAKGRLEALLARGDLDAGSARCLLITLGTLQFRENRADLAITTLTQAYREADAAGNLRQRILAASPLSKVMGELGDYHQALALNAELIEWNAAHDETLSLSVSRYLRGIILYEMREFDAALMAFANARALSVMLGDEQGIAFADMRVCQVLIDQGDIAGARQRCEAALKIFAASGTVDVIKQTRSLLAQVDLAEGRAESALATLNDILANGAVDMPPREVPPLFKLRAEANAARGNLPAAYADLGEYMRRFTKTAELRRLRQVAALHARFAIDREIDRNASLQRQLAESEQRRIEMQRRTWLAITAGSIALLLMTAMLIGTRRHRRQLAALANHDSLTGLPNRRYTAQLTEQALEHALRAGEPLTIALIDLDHFKAINDRCGHAGGDRVLCEFARLARNTLRATDTFGRWGGEEFLVAMPGTTLDVALAIVERVRAVALTIAVPTPGENLRVSLSAGLAVSEVRQASLDALVARADIALYRAKNDGRNIVRIDDASMDAASSGVRRALR
ncbi:MAG TPA: GGDEF domain-containing protein [Steroidobacteraceae bacterium]|nr:GGDEF domain-containing protein [Steroidobacteraceae bacterium]